MKSLYFDLIGGISGDMTVAALLDLGVRFKFLKAELDKMPVRGYALKTSRVVRGHAEAVRFDVSVDKKANYSYRKIVGLIKGSRLSAGAKRRALAVYEVLAEAEQKVHGHAHRDIHFHEVGSVDSIVDIVGTAVCLEALGADEILYSVVPVNHFLAPATMQMLAGKQVYFTGQNFENVTPTGMAILAALGRQVSGPSQGNFEAGRTGAGGGALDPLGMANALRVTELKRQASCEADAALVLEANIDDMNPQFFEGVFENLLAAGALDVFVTPVVMKKSRPAFLLTVLSKPEYFDKITGILLGETTTIGVRYYQVNRMKLRRETGVVVWKGRRVRVKRCALPNGTVRIQPEYEDCKASAKATGVCIADVYRDVKKKAEGCKGIFEAI